MKPTPADLLAKLRKVAGDNVKNGRFVLRFPFAGCDCYEPICTAKELLAILTAPRKQTSPRVSSIAGRALRAIRKTRTSLPGIPTLLGITLDDWEALAGSCLAQDEVKGQKPKKRANRKASR
jgi:hypothetical protein